MSDDLTTDQDFPSSPVPPAGQYRYYAVVSVDFEGDHLFGEYIKDDDPARREIRIHAYGVFDRPKLDHRIEIYIRNHEKYDGSWSEVEGPRDRSSLAFSMPEKIFHTLYTNIIDHHKSIDFIIVLSAGELQNDRGMFKYPCRFECLQIVPIHKDGGEALISALSRIEKVILYGFIGIGASLLLLMEKILLR